VAFEMAPPLTAEVKDVGDLLATRTCECGAMGRLGRETCYECGGES
jgi:hypothetical protein